MDSKFSITFWFWRLCIVGAVLLLCGGPGPQSMSMLMVEGLDCPTCFRVGSNGSDSCSETLPCNDREDYLASARTTIRQRDEVIVMFKEAEAERAKSEGTPTTGFDIWISDNTNKKIAQEERRNLSGLLFVCAKYLGSAWVTVGDWKSFPYTEAKCVAVDVLVIGTCVRGLATNEDMDQVRFRADKRSCTCTEDTVSKCQVSQEELLRSGADRGHGPGSGKLIFNVIVCFWLFTKLIDPESGWKVKLVCVLILLMLGLESLPFVEAVKGLDCPTCFRVGPNGSDSCSQTMPCNNREDFLASARATIKQRDDVLVKLKQAKRVEINDTNFEIMIWDNTDEKIAKLEGESTDGLLFVCAKYLGRAWVGTMQPSGNPFPYTEAKCVAVEALVSGTCAGGIPTYQYVDQVVFHTDQRYCTCKEDTVSKCRVSQKELLRSGADTIHAPGSWKLVFTVVFCFWLFTKLIDPQSGWKVKLVCVLILLLLGLEALPFVGGAKGLLCRTCFRIGQNGTYSCEETRSCDSHRDYIVSERDIIEHKDETIKMLKLAKKAEVGDSDGEISMVSSVRRSIAELEEKEIEGRLACTKRVGYAWVVTLKKETRLPYVEAKCDHVKGLEDRASGSTCTDEDTTYHNVDQVRFKTDERYCICDDQSTVSECEVTDEELQRDGAEATTSRWSFIVLVLVATSYQLHASICYCCTLAF